MQLHALNLTQYRNITQGEFIPHPELTVICGNNGQGKTNLLEAVWLCTGGKSFRGGKDIELIQKNQEYAVLEAKTENQEQISQLRITIGTPKSEKPGRNAKKNGVDVGRATNLVGNFTAVVFAPSHLTIVKGSPDGRRRFLDGALCQLYPNFLTVYRRYMRAVTQKNAFLKKFQGQMEPTAAETLLEVYNTEIARQGEEIQKRRLAYLALLSEYAVLHYDQISKGAETLSIRYLPQFEAGHLYEKLAQNAAREIRSGCCLIGPHREDFELLLNKEPSKVYASQGQQRSIVLSLKLAEAAVVKEITSAHPAILLDDVLSELDESRQSYLLTKMQEKQVFVTCCDESAFSKTNGKIVLVEGGIIKER